MVKITDGFQLSASVDLSVLDHIPIMDHPYGDSQPSNDVFRWMTYYNANGEIGFARNLGTFMPEVAECVVSFLSRCMEGSFDPHRVNFMRTRGSIDAHTDEGGRRCCINIGIRDSDAAITRTSNDNRYETFSTCHTDHVVEVGSVYLLDVSRIHSVVALDSRERLLITYGFGATASQVLSRVKKM